MKHLFQNSNTLRILTWFFQNPKKEISLRALARQIKFAPSTLSRTLKYLTKDNFLSKRKEANLTYFKAAENQKFKALKVAHTISVLQDSEIIPLIEENSQALSSLLLYGSAARGEDGSTSDYDFLIIAQGCSLPHAKLSNILKRETNLKHFTISQWEKISKENRAFYLEAISNSIALIGQKPVID